MIDIYIYSFQNTKFITTKKNLEKKLYKKFSMKSFFIALFATLLVAVASAAPVNLIAKKAFNITDGPFSAGPQCGDCGKAYQACCFGYGAKGYPCDCHLTEGGSGTAGSNCGDCGVGYAACCVGFDKDGYPCQCDVL